MFEKMKNMFSGKKTQKVETKLSEKEEATKNGKPWVKVLDTNVDQENPKYGYFELDWNKPFVENLKEHGFSGKSDEEVVDHWFSVLCNAIASEQTPMRNGEAIVTETKRGDGKTEIS